jgi:hypothetical protein
LKRVSPTARKGRIRQREGGGEKKDKLGIAEYILRGKGGLCEAKKSSYFCERRGRRRQQSLKNCCEHLPFASAGNIT